MANPGPASGTGQDIRFRSRDVGWEPSGTDSTLTTRNGDDSGTDETSKGNGILLTPAWRRPRRWAD